MKKLYMILLAMVLVIMGVISPLYATEAQAATKVYVTESNKDKLYFPMHKIWSSEIKIPLKYNAGTLGGKTFYDMSYAMLSTGYKEVYTFTYDKKVITVKTEENKSTGRKHIVVSPKKMGTTTLKIKISHPQFNAVTLTTKITITDKELNWKYANIKDKYKQEYDSVKSGILNEQTKLFLFELNKERSTISLKERYKSSAYEFKLAQETIKLHNNLTEDPECMNTLKVGNKVFDKIAKQRMSQLTKLNKMDNHEGLDELLADKFYDAYMIGETLCQSTVFRYPSDIVKSYKGSPLHWGQLTDVNSNYISAYTFKTNNGTMINVAIPGTDFLVNNVDVSTDSLNLWEKYAYLMTPEEREYYGVDDIYDEEYEEYTDEYDWSI
ncbi:hypothetical protein Ana3638_04885 [Anaerocolumna sedimenticola]|uniref:SCP domain-containing protein n=1 Tax=Anaerocolumna sedimenticola TaxID=2696063 RepID=A0A6P1TKM6_9FIRM|nr:hypothetical protein [Anaerocolumna sedimenticola]QHQ60195.1 hypothetical protein Ana3638_04885 [Anaerocolumna sedimenticola]